MVHDLTPICKLLLVCHGISTDCEREHSETSRVILHKGKIQNSSLLLFFVFTQVLVLSVINRELKKANKHTRNSPLSQIDWEVLFCVMSVFTSAWGRKMENKFKLASCLLTIYHIFLLWLLPLRSKGNKSNARFRVSYWAYFILK